MSQLGGPNSQEIGGVHFTIGAQGAEQTKAAVDQTAASVQNLGNAANTAAGTGGGDGGGGSGLRGFAGAVKGATKPLRDAISSIVGVIGAFTRMLGIIGLVSAAIGGLISLFKNLGDSAKEAAKEATKASGDIFTAFTKLREGEVDKFDKQETQAFETRKKLEREVMENAKLTEDQRQRLYDQIKREYELTFDLIQLDKTRTKNTDEQVRQHKAIMEATKNRYEFEKKISEEIDARNKRIKDDWDAILKLAEKIDQETLRAQAERLDALEKFMDQFQSQQSQLFNGSGSSFALQQMVSLLESINSKSGGRF